MNDTRVLFTTLSMRKSAKGNDYCVGWLGNCELIGFPGEPDKFGNPTMNLYLQAKEKRAAQPTPERETVTEDEG